MLATEVSIAFEISGRLIETLGGRLTPGPGLGAVRASDAVEDNVGFATDADTTAGEEGDLMNAAVRDVGSPRFDSL